MSNLQQNPSLKGLLERPEVKEKFNTILRERSSGFMANLAVMVNNSEMLKTCDPLSIVSASVISASLDLPLDTNLGMAAIVPFRNKEGQTLAQFQIMYKGLIQLCIRSGQYKTIGVTEILEGQIISENPLTSEYEFDFSARKSDNIIGYAAFFKTIAGFEKTIYWPIEKIDKHGKRFSKTYSKGFGLWKDDFDAMAKKTVLKSLLNTWGPKSIEVQRSIIYDQSIIKDMDGNNYEYADNEHQKSFDESEDITAKKVE